MIAAINASYAECHRRRRSHVLKHTMVKRTTIVASLEESIATTPKSNPDGIF
jgi:hypothetical protein